MRLNFLFLFMCFKTLLCVNIHAADVSYTQKDSLLYVQYIGQFSADQNKPINELMVGAARFFLGKPYVASTLDKSDREKLVVNLREFDCTTFVETCIVLSKVIQSGDFSFANYCQTLRKIRYREGEINDYSSRLHYVSDWMYENERLSLLRNISEELGGKLKNEPVFFMSSHVSAYPQLIKSELLRGEIKKTEIVLNKRGGYYVIDKQSVENAQNQMKDGDIVVFSTSIAGLDFTHIAIAYTDNGRSTFIHASSAKGKVVVESKSLINYCKLSPKCDGIVVLRLNDK